MPEETTQRRETGRIPWIAVLLSESHSTAPDYRPLFQEDFVLIFAADEGEARDRALRHGRSQESTITNDRGERVTSTLRTVVDVAPALEERLDRDADLYSRFFRDIASYEAFEPLLSGEEL